MYYPREGKHDTVKDTRGYNNGGNGQRVEDNLVKGFDKL